MSRKRKAFNTDGSIPDLSKH